jgi:hypothetical protein
MIISHFFKIHYNIILPPTNRSASGLFRSGISTKILQALLIYSMRTTYITDRTLLVYITLIIFGEGCNLRSSTLCNFLQNSFASYLRGADVLRNRLLLSTLRARYQVSLSCKTPGNIRPVLVLR